MVPAFHFLGMLSDTCFDVYPVDNFDNTSILVASSSSDSYLPRAVFNWGQTPDTLLGHFDIILIQLGITEPGSPQLYLLETLLPC